MTNNRQMVWIGRHEGLLRDVARGCAYGDSLSLKQGARILSPFIQDRSYLVPMPSHIGYATTMLSLCRWIKAYTSHCRIWDGLECDPHESNHIVKMNNGVPPEFRLYLRHEPPRGRIYIIDNTIATGMTARKALDCLPGATVLSITKG